MARILVIDDDPEILALLKQFLERQGMEVDVGTSGGAMWQSLAGAAFDLVILDVLLPGTDGLTLCRELRAQSDIPIIILTALDEETDRVVGLEVGADDYLVKPFSARELHARIRAILRRVSTGGRGRSPAETRVFSFSGFRFDTRKRELRSPQGLIVHLSRSEFDLLRLFVSRPQEVMDRNEMSELLRGHALDAFDRSIDLHVSRLRNKLSPLIGPEEFIKTVRGTGYMFALDVTPAE